MDTFDSPRSSVPARLSGHRASGLAPRFGGASSHDPPPSPLSIRVALRAAKRYWWLVLALWVVGSAGIGAGIYLKIKPSYRATSLLRVSPSETDLYNIRGQGEMLDQFLNTQVALITSANVLTAAGVNPKAATLSRIQSAGDVVMELRKSIQVAILPGTYLIEVSMNSPSAYEAATLVNAVVAAFTESNGEWANGMTSNQITSLETYLADLKNQSQDLERRWKEYVARQEGNVVAIKPMGATAKQGEPGAPAITSLTVEQFKRIHDELFHTRMELAEKDAVAQTLRREVEAARDNPAIEEDRGQVEFAITRRIRTDPEIKAACKAVDAARAHADSIKLKARQGNDPAYVKAIAKFRALNAEFLELCDAKKVQFRDEVLQGNGEALDPAREVREIEAEVARLKIKADRLDAELAKVKLSNKREATDSVEVELINEKRVALLGMQQTIEKRLEQLKYESKGDARIRPVHLAVPPGRPLSDKRVQYLAMAPVGVLGCVLVLALLLEIRSARVGDTDVLSSRVRHEVFAIAPLPNIRPGEDANAHRAEQRLARFVQSLDHLRVALCEGGTPGEGRCVMITSATGGEGKTTLSAHLAARCANAGTTTLLIDPDRRRASHARLLDVPAGPGLADVLAGEAELDSALVSVGSGGFHFLSAGTSDRDPSRVLKSSRLAELIGQLRQTYDLVLIDTPPILPVADALILGRWTDGAVMAARYDASRLPLVERANRQLAVAGIPVLGVVVNGVRGHDTTYGNYAYSYSYLNRPDRSVETPSS